MPESQEVIRVFIASPGDIIEEREMLEAVIDELNLTLSKSIGRRYELLKWETHSRPAKGEYPQDVINKQISKYDVFIGIMWSRFGTCTPVAESGTEEEFLRACESYESDGGVRELMFYFKDQAIPPSKMDADQLKKVQMFKKSLRKKHKLLYHEYNNVDEFQSKVRIHLSTILQEWSSLDNAMLTAVRHSEVLDTKSNSDPLAIFNALAADTEDEEGIIELMDSSSDSMNRVVEIIGRIVDAMNSNTEAMNKRTEQLNSIPTLPQSARIRAVKRISDNVAADLDLFNGRMVTEIPNFIKYHSLGMDSYGQMALISKNDFQVDNDSVRETLAVLQGYRESMHTAYKALELFRNTTHALPRMTKIFIRSRRRTVALMDDFLNQLKTATNQVLDIEDLLEGILSTE